MSLRGGQEKTKKKSFTWLVDFSFRPHEIHLGVMMMMMLGSSSFRSKAKGQTRLTYSSNIFFVFGLLGRIPAGTLASGVHNNKMYLLKITVLVLTGPFKNGNARDLRMVMRSAQQ